MALLTPQGVKKVFQLQKPEGREHLRRLLNWEEFDELRDSRRSILLDTLYESIIFAVGKGFPWVEVAQVVKFTEELLNETKGCSITEAVTILGNKLGDYQGQLNTTHLLAQCDYFHNTFIRHYKLYQYVLGQDQDVKLTVTHLEVYVPPQPLPLAAGKDLAVWKHEQQVVELSAAEVQKRAYMLQLKEALQLEQQHLLQEAPGAPRWQYQVLKREELENLINEAIHIQIECLKELLQYEIQITFDILDLKLQKKTLNLNAPTPSPLPVTGQSGQDEALNLYKANKGRKAKAKKM
uniref:Chromosome 8 open reading frame 74 n=1 Tax=Phocoena sinus TaxID=42100 RepID=A0A8C9CB33_PHOSS